MIHKLSLKNWSGTAAVIGADWGDSGKGRLIDNLSPRADIVARYNGGSNTGHTIKNKFGNFALHIMPSGIFNPKTLCLVGRGVIVDLEVLIEDELSQLKNAKVSWKNLTIDPRASLVMPWHKLRDGLREDLNGGKIGTTKKGVGPAYGDRVERSGLNVKDLISKDFEDKLEDEIKLQNRFYNLKISKKDNIQKYKKYANIIKPHVKDTIKVVEEHLSKKKNILFEGAQGFFLDIDAGTYPFVTSSNTGIVGIWRSYDLHPAEINHVIAITKAYTTRVGKGPMPTAIKGKERDLIIKKGGELGVTTGRVRDPGWLDLVLLKFACQKNKADHIAMTKLDILSNFEEIKLCVGYELNGKITNYVSGDGENLEKCKPIYESIPGWSEDISKIRDHKKLPKNAKKYIKKIEDFVGVPIDFIGVGPNREEVIYA